MTLIQPGAAPYQTLRYHLTRGARTTSELVCDVDVKNDGRSDPMPTLVVDLETTVDDVLADGSAKLRITIVRTTVRDKPGSEVSSDALRAQATAIQGVVITETLAPDGKLSDSHVEAATTVPDKARAQLDSLSRSLEQVAMRMPAEPVGIGATWRERKTLPEGGIRAVSDTLYTLTSITGTTVVYMSAGASSGAPQTIEQDGVKVEVTDTRGHSEAKGSVDLSRFVLEVASASTFATAMNVVAPQGTPGAGPSKIEITMAIQVSQTDRPAEPAAGAPAGSGDADAAVAPAEQPSAADAGALGAGSAQGAHNAP